MCEDLGLIKKETITKCLTNKPILNMPQYPPEEIEAIKKETGDDISKMTEEELIKYCNSKNIDTDKTMAKGKLFDELFKNPNRYV